MENVVDRSEDSQNTQAAQIDKQKVKVKQTKKNLILLSLVVALYIFFNAFPYRLGMVVGDSMRPTMEPNHLFVMDIKPESTTNPSRLDVVVFKHQGVTLVKRVVAVQSDTIWLARSAMGTEIVPTESVEQYKKIVRNSGLHVEIVPLVVPAGSVFVLGDNRMNSEDSRDYGPVPVNEIEGKVVYTENWKFLKKFRKQDV